MTTITLKEGENLIDKVYSNKDITIYCNGNNKIENCMFNKITSDRIIDIVGENVEIINCRFTEIIKCKILINVRTKENKIVNNLFYSGKSKIIFIMNNYNNIFSSNRIENWNNKKIMSFFNSVIINNEIINCLGSVELIENNQFLCNKIDNKNMKKSIGIILDGQNNNVMNNEIKNCEIGIELQDETNEITFNDFSNINKLYNCKFNGGYMIQTLIIQNNNYCNIKQEFNRKCFDNNVVKKYENTKDKEIDFNFQLIKHYNELPEDLVEYGINYSIKYVEKKEEEKKEEVVGNCCCHKLSKMIKINEKLAEYRKMNMEMGKLIKEIRDIMK